MLRYYIASLKCQTWETIAILWITPASEETWIYNGFFVVPNCETSPVIVRV